MCRLPYIPFKTLHCPMAKREDAAVAKQYRLIFRDQDQEAADRRTVSLAGFAVTLLVLVVCFWVTRQLQHKSAIEDCLMAGRLNCDILVPKLR